MREETRPADVRRRELLALALADDARVDAWLEFSRANPIEELSRAESHFLPSIAARLSAEPDREGLSKLRGVARYWWTRNATLLRSISVVGQSLDRDAVPWLVVGESAVACLHPEGLVRRPLKRVTLAISPRGAAAAVRAACDAGWDPGGWAIARAMEPLRFADLRSAEGNVLRLLWSKPPADAAIIRARDLAVAPATTLLRSLLEDPVAWSSDFPELWEIDLALLLLGPLAGSDLNLAAAGTRAAPEACDRMVELRAILRRGTLYEHLGLLVRGLSPSPAFRREQPRPSFRAAVAYLRIRWKSRGAAGFLATLARKLSRRVRMR